ncbi:MAG TPA: DUF72 domain-containing protein [Gemmatimonadales bacterium]
MIRFGVAGWDYKDWWGPVYPIPKSKGFDPLSYLARFYDTIEINSTFYRPPSARSAESWARRVGHNPRFSFTAKLWRRFTHDRGEAWSQTDVDTVRDGFAPLHEAGKLGCLLMQFPWSYKRDVRSREWLDDLTRAFRDFPLALEVRHASWNAPEFYAALAERGVGAVNIDQPVFAKSITPDAKVTSGVGYVRLHGRNYENWFRDDAESHERYDYLYTKDELRGWLDRIHEVARHAQETYVITNNHYVGQAPANASMLRKMYGEDAEVPPELMVAFADTLGSVGIGGAM